jgi:hypothetical protein
VKVAHSHHERHHNDDERNDQPHDDAVTHNSPCLLHLAANDLDGVHDLVEEEIPIRLVRSCPLLVHNP